MIAWFARNGVAANLLMLLVVVGGLGALMGIKKELFPKFSLDTIFISVPYRGASPEEVEEGVIIRIEEALQGLDGINELTSNAQENFGAVTIQVTRGYDLRKVKEEVKTRIDAITTFPLETERPIIEEFEIQRDVIWIGIYGEADEVTLKYLAEKVRDDLVQLPDISQAAVQGVRNFEISIEVSEHALRKYRLTFDDVMRVVRGNSIDMPAGQIRTKGGEILLRTKEQAYTGEDFAELIVISRDDGAQIRLGDIATIVDGFEDHSVITEFNGKPASLVVVREAGKESPLKISKAVKDYLEASKHTWIPEGIEMVGWSDASYYLQGRLNLMVENGAIGFVLVLLSLTLFLRPSLAMFVAVGIPVCFLGTFLIGPFIGLTINLISMFAFILVLGIVVDDAIVVGESVLTEFQKNGPGVESAIRGTHRVSTPVTFAVITTIVAFFPIFFLPGLMGKFLMTIPLVVIPTLAFSLVQSKLVLPYHLSLCRVGDKKPRSQLNPISRLQRKVSDGLEWLINASYRPTLKVALEYRYATWAGFIAILAISIGLVIGGWIRFVQFPDVPSDFIVTELRMLEGTPIEETTRAIRKLEKALEEVSQEAIARGEIDPVAHKGLFVGSYIISLGPGPAASSIGSNMASIIVELAKSEIRDSNAFEVTDAWREKVGDISGVQRLIFQANAAGPVGLPVDIRLVGPDFDDLKAAAVEIQERIGEFEGVYDIRNTYSEAKQEIKIKLKKHAHTLGLNASDLARQVRMAFYGGEAQRLQRHQDDVRVMVRYPKADRGSVGNLENMYIRTQSGAAVPISEVANIEFGAGYPNITRINRQRSVNVQAVADKDIANPTEINRALYPVNPSKKRFMEMIGQEVQPSITEQVLAQYPGIVPVKSGEAKDMEELMPVLISGMLLITVAIYALLAIPFKSYLQPFIVISVIPFGVAGAIMGHMVNFQDLGTFQDLSALSYMGIIALSGVVVNDSLVLVHYINELRSQGVPLREAVIRGGVGRFRPILLTSVTTFVGLFPILLEKSLQAKFLIPMATSLSFGVLFATFITLLLVPSFYLILEDVIRILERLKKWIIGLYSSPPIQQ